VTATIWDTNNKSAGVALSGTSLVATITSGVSGVAATHTLSGLTYFEVTIGTTLSGTVAIGLVNRFWSNATGAIIGSDANSVGYQQNGLVRLNGVTLTTIATYAASACIGVAIDPANRLIWFRVNGGNWNNDVIANQNPVGMVGGISLATLSSGGVFPAFGGTTTSPNQSGTATFTSGFTYAAPTGYGSVDTIACRTVMCDKAVSAKAVPTTGYSNRCGSMGANALVITGGWYGSLGFWSPASPATTISGTVTELGAPVARTVFLYEQATGLYLGKTTSDPTTGSFSIPALGRKKVFVVGVDAPYQALVFDQLTPA
jgi:hypothetical protein